jgi:hypothetical protein
LEFPAASNNTGVLRLVNDIPDIVLCGMRANSSSIAFCQSGQSERSLACERVFGSSSGVPSSIRTASACLMARTSGLNKIERSLSSLTTVNPDGAWETWLFTSRSAVRFSGNETLGRFLDSRRLPERGIDVPSGLVRSRSRRVDLCRRLGIRDDVLREGNNLAVRGLSSKIRSRSTPIVRESTQ